MAFRMFSFCLGSVKDLLGRFPVAAGLVDTSEQWLGDGLRVLVGLFSFGSFARFGDATDEFDKPIAISLGGNC